MPAPTRCKGRVLGCLQSQSGLKCSTTKLFANSVHFQHVVNNAKITIDGGNFRLPIDLHHHFVVQYTVKGKILAKHKKEKMHVQQALREIESFDTIIIHRHSNPDGDALGSQIGLYHIIKANFPHKKVFMVGDMSQRYAFMEGAEMDDVPQETYADALAIVLDTSAKHLISNGNYALAKRTVRFDHHMFVEQICQHEVVDTTYESCCGLIADFAMQNNLEVPVLAAKSLYTGMVTDSGRFRFDSTTSRTFALASFLMKQPFDMTDVYINLYSDSLQMMQLRAKCTLNIQLTPNNVAYIYTDKQTFLSYGVDSFTISRGMVGTMSEIKGVGIWVNFTETDQGVLCELRSKRHNINQIAVKYGGGGHLKASGATVPNKQVAMQMLADLDLLATQ